mgnify:CR=1 FL=1
MFNKLFEMLHAYIFRQDSNFCKAISFPERVAITLFMLAHGLTGSSCLAGMNRARSSSTEILHEFCYIISKYFYHVYVTWFQNESEVKESIAHGRF